MSDDNKILLTKNWLTFANIVVMVSFIVYQARWQQKTDSELKELQTSVIKHHADKDEHMPFKDKIELFVPRTELEGRLNNIENLLIKIEERFERQ